MADGGFTATAGLERDGARVEGKAGYGGSKKTARQAAALSLLAALTGLAVPAGDDPPAAPRGFPDDPGLSPSDLESWLDYEVARPSPNPELATAVQADKLTARSVYLLLFEADPRGWASARAAAWEALASASVMAGGVLSMYSQALGWPTVRYIETGERSALAFLPAPDGLVVGAPSRAATAKAARAGAALALLRDLAPPARSQTGDPERTTADRSPVAVLNERAQTGVISELSYQHDASGPPHAPVFTCTASCAHATGSYTCAAEGRTKNEAKTAAAARLLDQITEQERSAAAQLARAAEADACSGRGIFGRLLRVGCALDFRDRRFEVTGPAGAALEGPLAGFTLPLLAALPVLATFDGPAADGSAALLHESARAWARAARSALEAVTARRAYPALDVAGRGGGGGDGPDPSGVPLTIDQAMQLKVQLKYFRPPIWRSVVVPSLATLGDLHRVIQTVFGWDGDHLHAFRVRDAFRGKIKVGYEYDFGASWQHEITLQKVLPMDPATTYPVYVAFQGESPEEYPDAHSGGRKRKPYSLGSVNARLAKLGG